ncbi:four helix bundle protein [Kordia sp.]|uniref:four helix bundle protein n=1 Tax=Kordia sp. TaxID=1965332 RepID=UPI00344B6CF6
MLHSQKKDFAHKISSASKEARETKYWLQLLHKSNITNISVDIPLKEVEQLINIITKIVKTSQQNLK